MPTRLSMHLGIYFVVLDLLGQSKQNLVIQECYVVYHISSLSLSLPILFQFSLFSLPPQSFSRVLVCLYSFFNFLSFFLSILYFFCCFALFLTFFLSILYFFVALLFFNFLSFHSLSIFFSVSMPLPLCQSSHCYVTAKLRANLF